MTAFLDRHKAGSPTNPALFWISLRPAQIAAQFQLESGHKLTHGLIKRHLRALGYRFRRLQKQLATGSYADRDKQFKLIFSLVGMLSLQTPLISIDTKKKERLGPLHRTGRCYSQAPQQVYDHDYEYLARGKVVPHGIYDLLRNQGYISIGTNAETAEFIVDNLLWWWDTYGIHQYGDCKQIMILCDAGGANSYRHHCFKKRLLWLSAQIGRDLLICHYPPYCSKWNPIEHRLFAHVHRAMEGVILWEYETVRSLMSQTSTRTGLSVEIGRAHV